MNYFRLFLIGIFFSQECLVQASNSKSVPCSKKRTREPEYTLERENYIEDQKNKTFSITTLEGILQHKQNLGYTPSEILVEAIESDNSLKNIKIIEYLGQKYGPEIYCSKDSITGLPMLELAEKEENCSAQRLIKKELKKADIRF